MVGSQNKESVVKRSKLHPFFILFNSVTMSRATTIPTCKLMISMKLRMLNEDFNRISKYIGKLSYSFLTFVIPQPAVWIHGGAFRRLHQRPLRPTRATAFDRELAAREVD